MFEDLFDDVLNDTPRAQKVDDNWLDDDAFDTGLPTEVEEKWSTGQEPDLWRTY